MLFKTNYTVQFFKSNKLLSPEGHATLKRSKTIKRPVTACNTANVGQKMRDCDYMT
jgi:hypothetical protein